jgi:hypothetical protein
MTVTKRLIALSAISALALACLTACDPGSGTAPTAGGGGAPSSGSTAAARPSPTTTEVAPVEAASILITGSSVSVLDADAHVIVDIPFGTESESAAAQLAEALDAHPATIAVTADGSCRAARTDYDFGGLILNSPAHSLAGPGAAYTIKMTGTETAGGVDLMMPGGQRIGASVSAVLAAVPGSVLMDRGDGAADVFVDFEAPDGPNAWGAVAFAQSGVVMSYHSPIYFYGDC